MQGRFHCLAVDLPGSGDSYQTEWLSFADTAVSLADIIRQKARNGQAHVVGLSLGGYAALHLMADFPGLVLSTIVSGVTLRPFPNQPHYRLLPHILSRIIGWNVVINLTAKMMQLPEEAIPIYRRDSRRLSAKTIKRVYAEVFAFHPPAGLPWQDKRLLAVAGEKEARLVRDNLADFHRLKTAVSATVPNAHHGWNADYPALFTKMIEAWVEERPLPQPLRRFEARFGEDALPVTPAGNAEIIN